MQRSPHEAHADAIPDGDGRAIAIEALRRDASVICKLIANSSADRLFSLTWHGLTILDLLVKPSVLQDVVAQGIDTSPGHALGRFLYQTPVTSAASGSSPTTWCLPGLSVGPWHDDSLAKRVLEEASPNISAEFSSWSLELRPHPDTGEVVTSGSWSSLFLIEASGRLNAEAARHFPNLLSLMDVVEPCRNFGFVAFFKTKAGTAFARHTGSTNLRLRHQLCVDLSDDTLAYIDVGGEKRTWALGRCLAFDDSFPHEVHHLSGGPRVVLAFDAWHPGLTANERSILAHPVFARFGKVDLRQRKTV